ncbi:MAG TPA: hypothetical protein VE028_03880 [Nitratidesulfovibrio sp.]|nr:hypothetical protein [Nitratidesulfovibrio sp.]
MLAFDKGALHFVEGLDVPHLPRERLLAGEAHGEERETVAGEQVGGIGALAPGGHNALALRLSKIRRSQFVREIIENFADVFQHAVVRLLEVFRHADAGNKGTTFDEVNDGGKAGVHDASRGTFQGSRWHPLQ